MNVFNTDHVTVTIDQFIDGPAPAGWVTFYHEAKSRRISLYIADIKTHDPELYERLKTVALRGGIEMSPEDHARLAKIQDALPTFGRMMGETVKPGYWMR